MAVTAPLVTLYKHDEIQPNEVRLFRMMSGYNTTDCCCVIVISVGNVGASWWHLEIFVFFLSAC